MDVETRASAWRCIVSRGAEKRLTESRFATLNVCGGMDKKLNEVLQLMNERKIDDLCVNETKRKGCRKDPTQHTGQGRPVRTEAVRESVSYSPQI